MTPTASARTLFSERDLVAGCAALVKLEPRFAVALVRTGPLSYSPREEGFAALLRAVVGQQVSAVAARSIWARLEAAGVTTPEGVRGSSDEGLRELGMSRQKVRYARALAAANIDFAGLRGASDEQLVAELTRVDGIGRWTAEIYGLFALGRADLFAAGDLALQESARLLFALPQRPSEGALRASARAWSPWRSVAAHLLWAYYRVHQGR